MNIDELFLDAHNLPEPLSKEELYNLIQEFKDGSKEARDKIIIHNIRLVLHEVLSKFKNPNYDKKELVSIGIIGLINAVDTYDISKGYKFSSYAARCIDNVILMYLKRLKTQSKHTVDSLNRVVLRKDKHTGGLKLEDLLCDDRNFVEELETAEAHKIIREIVNDLPEKNREIIKLYFGFYDNQIYTQKQIAAKMNISQSYVSLLIIKTIEQIGKKYKILVFRNASAVKSDPNQSDLTKDSEEEMQSNPIGIIYSKKL